MSAEDAIEKVIGRFGRYQSWILFLILLSRMPTEYQLTNVVFILPNVNYVCMDEDAFNMTNHCPCKNPQYDTSTIVSSVTSEFDLICQRGFLASLAQSIMQIGVLAGSLIFGYISDRYGRKIAVLTAVFMEAVFITISAVVPELWMFIVLRFLIGIGVGGTMLCCYILLIELCGKSFRAYLTGLHEISYILGYFTLPIIAYFVREWRTLQLVTSVPWLLLFVYYWLIPESPRWLITVGRKREAIVILTNIAKKNNRPIENIEAIIDELEAESMKKEKESFGSYLDLFRTKKVRVYTFIVACVWMCCSHTHFGINQYIGRLQGNIYINVMISSASLVPGIILVVITSLYLRRKVSVIITFSIAAVSLLVFIFIPSHLTTLTHTFATIGLTGAYTAFVQIYLYTSEVFPTIIRNSAMGFASVFARVGGFLAPFVVNIGVEWISIMIFSSLAFCAAVLCCFLPETKDTVLLNTIEQVEHTSKTELIVENENELHRR